MKIAPGWASAWPPHSRQLVTKIVTWEPRLLHFYDSQTARLMDAGEMGDLLAPRLRRNPACKHAIRADRTGILAKIFGPFAFFLAISVGELRFWRFFPAARSLNWPRAWRMTWPSAIRPRSPTIPRAWCRSSGAPTYSTKSSPAPLNLASRTRWAGTREPDWAARSSGNSRKWTTMTNSSIGLLST